MRVSIQDNSLYNQIGTMQVLFVVKKTQHGIYLARNFTCDALESCQESVLLPNVYTDGNEELGDKKEVFLYTDSDDRIVATTKKPLALKNEIALLSIKDRNEYGLFLDIGLAKDIFMPTKFPDKYVINTKIVVRITCDKEGRLIAKKDITPLLKPCKSSALLHKRVEIFVVSESSLGFLCVVFPYYYQGMIYHNTLQQALTLNAQYFARVVKVRRDGKLDLILERNKEGIITMIKQLNKRGEYFNITPIALQELQISKKGLKKEISELIAQKKIIFSKDKGYSIPAMLPK